MGIPTMKCDALLVAAGDLQSIWVEETHTAGTSVVPNLQVNVDPVFTKFEPMNVTVVLPNAGPKSGDTDVIVGAA